jgi:uncharacterized protein Yka (UPF0111/DUF47 family)
MIEPDAKRFRRFVSSFVNFWTFCNGQHEYVSEKKEAVSRMSKKADSMTADIRHNRETIAALRKSQQSSL